MTKEERKKQEAIQKAVSEWNASKPSADYKEFIVFVSYDQDNEIGFLLSNGCKVGPYDSNFAV